MPNWCENRLAISGDVADVKAFVKKGLNEKGEWCLDNYHPMPKEYHNDGRWYDWRLANWGTKWDVDAEVNEDDDVIHFLSAWSPPIEWLHKVGVEHPHLSFRLTFVEGGAWFAGMTEIIDGEVIGDSMCEPMYVNEDGDELDPNEIDWDTDFAMLVCPYDYE